MHRLVFVEFHETMTDAIFREKRIEKWPRAWKLELIDLARIPGITHLICGVSIWILYRIRITSEPMHDLTEIGSSPLRCLWLTRVYPVPPDAGDLTYSFHLLSSLSRAGVRLTVLAMRRTGDRVGSASENGIKWVVVPSERDREICGRLAVRSLFSHLPNVATQYNTASFRRALRKQMARDWDAIVVDHLGMGWVWPVVEAYRRQKAGVVSVFIAHNCEGEVRRSVARNFRGNIVRKIALSVDATKADRLEKKLARQSNLVSAITAEDLCRFGDLDKIRVADPRLCGPARRLPRDRRRDAAPSADPRHRHLAGEADELG